MKRLIAAFNYTQVTLMRVNTVATSINSNDHISKTPVMKPLPTLLVQVFGWVFFVCSNQDIKILPSSAVWGVCRALQKTCKTRQLYRM